MGLAREKRSTLGRTNGTTHGTAETGTAVPRQCLGLDNFGEKDRKAQPTTSPLAGGLFGLLTHFFQ